MKSTSGSVADVGPLCAAERPELGGKRTGSFYTSALQSGQAQDAIGSYAASEIQGCVSQ